MNDINLIRTVFQIDIQETIISIVILATVFVVLKTLIEKVYSAFDKDPFWIKKRRERDAYLDRLNDLERKHDEDAKRANDNNQKFKESFDSINDNITLIFEKLEIMDAESKQNKLAELKDKIGQSYRYYHTKKEWNDMEEEALRDLIARYEAIGGENSFVHDTVIPDSYTWRKTGRAGL